MWFICPIQSSQSYLPSDKMEVFYLMVLLTVSFVVITESSSEQSFRESHEGVGHSKTPASNRELLEQLIDHFTAPTHSTQMKVDHAVSERKRGTVRCYACRDCQDGDTTTADCTEGGCYVEFKTKLSTGVMRTHRGCETCSNPAASAEEVACTVNAKNVLTCRTCCLDNLCNTDFDTATTGGTTADACEAPLTLSQSEGEFGSPVNPEKGKYPGNSDCEWNIIVPNSKIVRLHFSDFDLESSIACQSDYVEIFDGPSRSSPVLGKYCGTYGPGDITGSTNKVTVVFYSNGRISKSGFHLQFLAKDQASSYCGIAEFSPTFGRIVGGTEAKPNSWPWQISLRYYGSHICGGTIVHPNWVVTAAHCSYTKDGSLLPIKRLSVRVGEHDRSSVYGTEENIKVAERIIHEGYSFVKVDHDIALLKLVTPMTFNEYVSPVCLPKSDVVSNMDCVATGWGNTEGTGDNKILRQVLLPIVAHEQCNVWYYGQINANMICAGYPEGQKDSCQGDSGGPLVCATGGNPRQYFLNGVTSFGRGCAEAEQPGVYCRVTRYINWMEANSNGEIVL